MLSYENDGIKQVILMNSTNTILHRLQAISSLLFFFQTLNERVNYLNARCSGINSMIYYACSFEYECNEVRCRISIEFYIRFKVPISI